MQMKRIISVLAAVLLLSGLLSPVSTKAAGTSGTCGDQVKWSYKEGTLTISGTGPMYDYGNPDMGEENRAPWFDFRQDITKIIIKEGVTYVGACSFVYVGGKLDEEANQIILFSLSLPSTVTKIGDDAFMWSALDKIDIPDTVTEIGEGAFAVCQYATTIKISKNLKEIPKWAFNMCAGLVDVEVPSGVTSIGAGVFGYCENLKTITLPASLTNVDGYAFYSDTGNKPDRVIYKGTKAHWNNFLAVEGNNMLTNAKAKYYKPYVAKPAAASISVLAFTTAIMKVSASGGGLNYQWQYRSSSSGSWTNVSAASGKTATYSLTTEARHNGYQYRCKVSNKAGTTYSKVITLTVISKPTITTQPKSVSVAEGKKATFTVEAEGAATYQWQYRTSSSGSWANVSAASGKTASYSLTAAARHNGYQYRCKVSNEAGNIYTKAATLTIVEKPVITTQPKNVTVTAGAKATFTVAATGAVSYQWQYRTSSSGSWTNVSSASGKKASYTLTTAARHNGYQYRCKVTNEAGNVYTTTVTLKVN